MAAPQGDREESAQQVQGRVRRPTASNSGRRRAGGLKGMGVGFLEWGASDPIPALPAQSSTLVSCLVEVGAASTSTTTAIHADCHYTLLQSYRRLSS